jgi:hypothetical protein
VIAINDRDNTLTTTSRPSRNFSNSKGDQAWEDGWLKVGTMLLVIKGRDTDVFK